MQKKTVFMFSGQGSQYFHMGLELHTQHAGFRAAMNRMDGLVRDLAGYSVVDALYDSRRRKGEPFDELRLTHPAIFMVEQALGETLLAQGIEPDLVLGTSLGTFAAASIAGFVTWERALSAVVLQARAVEAHAARGGMVAVLADAQLALGSEIKSRCEIAAYNFANHFAISAVEAELDPIESFLRSRNVTFQRLPVSFPFHSRWMDPVQDRIKEALRLMPVQPGRMPLACCAQGGLLTQLPPDHFWHVVRHPIRFQQVVATLEATGSYHYVDVGPSGTLATFLRYALPSSTHSRAFATLSPYGQDTKNIAALGDALALRH